MNIFFHLSVVACFLASTSWAQKPERCKGPPLYTGFVTLGSQNGKLWLNVRYAYDGIGQRIRVGEMGSYNHTTFTYSALFLYKEKIMYEIHRKNQTCIKRPLKDEFVPVEIPQGAEFLSQEVIGTLSAPGQGLVVNTWLGDMAEKGEHYMLTFSEYGCLPVSALVPSKDLGWVSFSYFNNVLGVDDPDVFIPPPFCKDAKLVNKEATFFSAFH